MASINLPREIRYRPCLVDGKKAIFHRWCHVSEIVAPSALKGGHPGGTVESDVAIVEFEDGSVATVYPHRVKFLDSEGLFRDYDWGENNV